jgi:hypothetical protein
MKKKIVAGFILCLNAYFAIDGQLQTVMESEESAALSKELHYVSPDEIVARAVREIESSDAGNIVSKEMRDRFNALESSMNRPRIYFFITGACAMCVIYKIRWYLINRRAKRKEEQKKEAHGQASR